MIIGGLLIMLKKENTVYIDMITTCRSGNPDNADINDLVKITIIDDNGDALLNTYVRPHNDNTKAWDITLFYYDIPSTVIDYAPSIDVVIDNIRDIVSSADNIVVYNANKICDYFKKWNLVPITLTDVLAMSSVHNRMMPLISVAYRCGYFRDDYHISYRHTADDTIRNAMMLRYVYHIMDKPYIIKQINHIR